MADVRAEHRLDACAADGLYCGDYSVCEFDGQRRRGRPLERVGDPDATRHRHRRGLPRARARLSANRVAAARRVVGTFVDGTVSHSVDVIAREHAGIQQLARRSVEVIRAGQAPSGRVRRVADVRAVPLQLVPRRGVHRGRDEPRRRGGQRRGLLRLVLGVLLAREHSSARTSRRTPATPSRARRPTSSGPPSSSTGWALDLGRARARGAPRHGSDRWRAAAELTGDYLARNWRRPCTDWWEEREGVHLATLACVWAGLVAWGRAEADDVLAVIAATDDGRLDASLLVLDAPLGVRHVDGPASSRCSAPAAACTAIWRTRTTAAANGCC